MKRYKLLELFDKLWITLTTEQMRLRYDASKYATHTVGSNGDYTVVTNGTEVRLEQTGDVYGTTRLKIVNRNGANGAIFENVSLDLVDFGFVPNSGSQHNLRLEHRVGSTLGYNNGDGEFQLIKVSGPLSYFVSGSETTVVRAGNFGVGIDSPSAKAHIIATTEQLRIGYDGSNYYKTTVGSTGIVTFDAVGSGSKFVFSDPVEGPINAYDASSWNGSAKFATEDAVRDKIETLLAGSGITRSITVTSGSATMGASASTDYVYLVAGAHTMTLPTAVGNTNRYTVKNNHSAAITVNTTSSQTIDGTTSISLGPQAAVDLISDGSNWSII